MRGGLQRKLSTGRTDALELCCWRRLLRVPWTARRSNRSILKEISPGISLEGMMLKLKLQYFGHLMRRVDSLVRQARWVDQTAYARRLMVTQEIRKIAGGILLVLP